ESPAPKLAPDHELRLQRDAQALFPNHSAVAISPGKDIHPVGRRNMIKRRPFEHLGGADHVWPDAKHHFSFGSHYDPDNMGWGSLRVWNDDTIQPGTGFPTHPHANMEIITYVREGAITHQDSLGNEGRTEAGDVQVMSAGTGIRHAE